MNARLGVLLAGVVGPEGSATPVPSSGELLRYGSSVVWASRELALQEFKVLRGDGWQACFAGHSILPEVDLHRCVDHYVKGCTGIPSSLVASGYVVIVEVGRTTIYGDLAGQCPIFYSHRDSGVVWSTSAWEIANEGPGGPTVSRAWMSAWLLAQAGADLWTSGSPFEDVFAVPADSALVCTDGMARLAVRSVPPPRATAGGAAEHLRGALHAAVRSRLAGAQVSCDLSGGLDSTSLAILATKQNPHPQPVSALTLDLGVAGSDDVEFAVEAIRGMSSIAHRTLIVPTSCDPFADLDVPTTDEPYNDAHLWARFRWWFSRIGELGAEIHVSGDGGDAVLMSSPAYLADFVRAGRWRELSRHAWVWARLRGRPVHALIRNAWRTAHIAEREAVAASVESLRRSHIDAGSRWEDAIAWVRPSATASWMTVDARRLAADALSVWLDLRHGLSRGLTPGDQLGYRQIETAARELRGWHQLAVGAGVRVDAPFFDDEVVSACTAVTATARTSPDSTKPLLQQAMRGVLRESVRRRETKGDYTSVAYRGLRDHASKLRDAFHHSRLAELGLIEDHRIRSVIDRGAIGLPIELSAFCRVLAAELWLRSLPNISAGSLSSTRPFVEAR